MLRTVPEVVDIIHITRQSLYFKLKQPLYKDKVITKHGQAYIDDDLLKLIQDNMKPFNKHNGSETITQQEEATTKDDTVPDEDIVKLNQILINTLVEQLKEKDNQIHEKDSQLENYSERLKQALELNRNNQILLKEKPKQELILLEEHFHNLDNKLIEIKDKMQKKDQEHRGIFKKIFKK
jgi:hypothetical protein